MKSELFQFVLQQDDLRFEMFDKIQKMLETNINLRININKLLRSKIVYSDKYFKGDI